MRLRVLVVEDDLRQRRMLVQLLGLCPELEVCGYTGDGEEGLELALAQSPDVILLDPILSGRSGLSILQEYRARGGKARVLAFTGASGQAARDAILGAGADFVLIKPAPVVEIAEHIQLLCAGMRGKIAARLEELDGGEVRLRGRKYAILAAEQLARCPDDAMKAVYLQIAGKENTSYMCVEKDIRSYIKCLHQLGKDAYRAALGQQLQEKPPSNAVFLRLLAKGAKIP